MVLGWLNLVAGVFCAGLAAYAAVRRWTPQRWGGLYKQFAVAVGGAALALTAYGVAYLTSETSTVANAARLVAIAGFLTAGAGLVGARRAERQRQQQRQQRKTR